MYFLGTVILVLVFLLMHSLTLVVYVLVVVQGCVHHTDSGMWWGIVTLVWHCMCTCTNWICLIDFLVGLLVTSARLISDFSKISNWQCVHDYRTNGYIICYMQHS